MKKAPLLSRGHGGRTHELYLEFAIKRPQNSTKRMNPSVFDLFRLDGKVALVVGGAHHLGYDMAAALAEAGSHVAITSRTLSAAEKSAGELSELYGVDSISIELDNRRHENVADAVRTVHKWKARIDILINNAGGGSGLKPAHIFERDPADAESLIAVNLTGVLHTCLEVARIMSAQHYGKIINIASVAALVGRDRRVYERNHLKGQPIDYAAAKAGVIGLTKDLAGLLSPNGICVNAISPGGFERPNMPPGFVQDYSNLTPLGRMGRDGVDLKGAALFLASAASDYVTGHNLVVDGGFSLWR
ncbi:MAG: SDR family oxidoreductase [Dechloromonas sp.]|nr:MAG: SDR family oxidoreductase [Dechloromonas sp.]